MIYVARHGETDLNKDGRLQGRSGLPLNENGKMQSQKLKHQLKNIYFDYVFSSPEERTVQFAEIVTGQKVTVDDRLDVFDLGEADGLEKSKFKETLLVSGIASYKGIEDISSYIERIYSFMRELETRFKGKDCNIFISGHKCTTGCICAYFEGMPKDYNFLKLSSANGEYKIYTFKKELFRENHFSLF